MIARADHRDRNSFALPSGAPCPRPCRQARHGSHGRMPGARVVVVAVCWPGP